jgi:hypothetical protein
MTEGPHTRFAEEKMIETTVNQAEVVFPGCCIH